MTVRIASRNLPLPGLHGVENEQKSFAIPVSYTILPNQPPNAQSIPLHTIHRQKSCSQHIFPYCRCSKLKFSISSEETGCSLNRTTISLAVEPLRYPTYHPSYRGSYAVDDRLDASCATFSEVPWLNPVRRRVACLRVSLLLPRMWMCVTVGCCQVGP